MSNKWVVNASPIILLAKVTQTDLLTKLTEQLVVPASVVAEVRAWRGSDPAQEWLGGEGASWIRPDITVHPALAGWDLGAGETAVLSWAHHHRGFEAILDDRAARKCATVEQIPVRGTLGVIVAAKVRGLIPSARTVCESIVQAGLRVQPNVVREALRLVGE